MAFRIEDSGHKNFRIINKRRKKVVSKNKNGQTESNIDLSNVVTPKVQLSNHFIESIVELSDLHRYMKELK